MFLLKTKDNELEMLINKVELAMSNNYKDMAQDAYKDFLKRYEEKNSLLKAKSVEYYDGVARDYESRLKNFHH